MTIETRICPNCQNEFVPKTRRQEFCSPKCRMAVWSNATSWKEIATSHWPESWSIAGRSVTIPCAQCGKPKRTTLAHVVRGVGRFCSTDCLVEYRHEHFVHVKTCPGCGREFKSVDVYPHPYCSRCRGKFPCDPVTGELL